MGHPLVRVGAARRSSRTPPACHCGGGRLALVEDARLFREASFVVTRTAKALGRALIKLLRRVDMPREHAVRDRAGQPIARVVPVTRRWRRALDTYTRFDVVDAGGTRLLALRATLQNARRRRSRRARDRRRAQRFAFGNSALVVEFHAGDRGGGVIRDLPPVIGRIAPRKQFPSAPAAFGVMEVLDAGGVAVARVTNTNMFDSVVEIEPRLDGALRLLTVAFACSLVDDKWMHLPARVP
jgi:hypothetical protein